MHKKTGCCLGNTPFLLFLLVRRGLFSLGGALFCAAHRGHDDDDEAELGKSFLISDENGEYIEDESDEYSDDEVYEEESFGDDDYDNE
jgi:hypothetical protein